MVADPHKDHILETVSVEELLKQKPTPKTTGAFLTKYRVHVIATFALTYPFASVWVRNALWRPSDDFYQLLGSSYFLNYTVNFLLHIFPGLLAFFWLPIKPTSRKVLSICGIAVAYSLIIFPLVLVVGYFSDCIFNPPCAPL